KTKAQVLWYGIDNEADIKAKNIKQDKNGSSFEVIIDNEAVLFQTKLLGRHNIYNILAAICIGLFFKIPTKQLQQAVKQLNYVPHRLEVLDKKTYTIIDNAFNSNPVGCKISLDVLALMPGQKICITPGLIDLGAKNDFYNKEFGQYFINRCDYVILVGKRQTKALYEGLQESNFNMKNVYIVDTIFEAYSKMNQIKQDGAYVLLENDLPDAFNI
ncbi:MAG: Mur ligase family protein, partial [Bacilli bacterium]